MLTVGPGSEGGRVAIRSALDLRKPSGPDVDRLAARYRARLLAALPGQVERIVLFGSRAPAAT
jgi:hypothetical protein